MKYNPNTEIYLIDKKMKNNQLIIYQAEDGKIKIETHFEDETVWLSQAQIDELFPNSKTTISEYIKNIFEEVELEEELVVRDFRTTTNPQKQILTINN